MNEKYLELCKELISEIEIIQNSKLKNQNLIERCFKLAVDYWNKVSDMVKQYDFNDDSNEIYFFKNVKPLFTGQIEYYTFLYQASLLPRVGYKDRLNYYGEELKRIDRFNVNNKNCIKDYESASAEPPYLLRRNNQDTNLSFKLYMLDPETSTQFDHIYARYVGYKLYQSFILEQVELINNKLETSKTKGS